MVLLFNRGVAKNSLGRAWTKTIMALEPCVERTDDIYGHVDEDEWRMMIEVLMGFGGRRVISPPTSVNQATESPTGICMTPV